MAAEQPSYIIVGAGVFGISTALHLIKRYPQASVTVVDRDQHDADTRVAASWDWNKVVRADYDDVHYCRMAIEAQEIFKTDPLWKPHFFETGIFWTCRDDFGDAVIANYAKIGRKADLKSIPVEEAKKMHNGVFEDADYSGVKSVLINKTSGWATAGDCLRSVTKEAIRLGVKYVVAEVASLLFNEDGSCGGIKTLQNTTFKAQHTILSTGAYTSKLLELSAEESGVTRLRAGDRIMAGGICTGMKVLDDEELPIYASMPVGVQGYTPELGPFIGSLPPTKDKQLKWWGQTIFRNTTEVAPGRFTSAPPDRPEYHQWKASKLLKKDIEHARDVFYGAKSKQWKMEKHRICWDAFTTSSDFIISPHSGAKGLYIATCGNFHGWKFFPVLGKYVMQMMEGTLSPELAEKWAWDRERPDPKDFADYPRYELRDLEDVTAKL